MTKKPTKFTPVLIVSKDGLTAAINGLVKDKLALAGVHLAMETEIAAIQKRHQTGIESLSRDIAAAEAGIQVFAVQHRDELFPKDVKSLDFALAKIGFRDTPHRVDKARSKDTFDEIAQRMAGLVIMTPDGKEVAFDGDHYVRYAEPELDKKALLADRLDIPEAVLKAVGIKFAYDEMFYIEPKSEVLEGRTEVAA